MTHSPDNRHDSRSSGAGAVLRAEGIRHVPGGHLALDIDELELREGETLCLMGPPGAGKSSLVRVLNLVEPLQAGRIYLDGVPVEGRDSPARHALAGVFGQPHMFRGSVADNVAYGLKLRGVRGPACAAQVESALDLLGIGRLAASDARRLSPAEAQRVALARALAVRPRILFLDEPAAGLGAAEREDFHRELRRVVHSRELTVLYVTGFIEEAMAVADRLAVMLSGELREIGSAADVYLRPRNPVTARFMGVENLLPGRVVDVVAGGSVVELYGGSRVYTRTLAGGTVLACVRGQEVTLHAPVFSEEPQWTANRYPALIEDISLAGGFYRVSLDCGGFHLEASVPHAVLTRLGAEVGAEVEARFDESAVHLIETGRAGARRRARRAGRAGWLLGDLQPEWFTEDGWNRGSDN